MPARPRADPRHRAQPAHFPSGCKFHTRCHKTRELAATAKANESIEIRSGDETFRVLKRCTTEEPELREVQPNHWARCHQLPQYPSASVTPPRLDHRRQVIPQAVEEADAGGGAESLADQEVQA